MIVDSLTKAMSNWRSKLLPDLERVFSYLQLLILLTQTEVI